MAGDPTFAHRRDEMRRRGIMTAVIIAVVVVVFRYVLLFSLIENFSYDLAYDLACKYSEPSPPEDIVIVAIDEESLRPNRLGRWPVTRDAHAELLGKLKRARVVAFDVIFSGPEEQHPEHDEAFAAAVRDAGNVVLATCTYKTAKTEYTGRKRVDWSYPLPAGPIALSRIQQDNFLQPIEKLARGAAAIGYVDIDADPDGVYRRVHPLRGGYDGKLYPHFATAIAQVASGATPEQIVEELPRRAIEFGDVRSPLSADGSMLISYTGPTGTVKRYPYWQVLAGRVSPSAFEDKIVIVGATAPGLYDIRSAPYRGDNRFFLGVETDANVVNTLLDSGSRQDARRHLRWALGAAVICLVISPAVIVGLPLSVLLIILIVALRARARRRKAEGPPRRE